MEWRLVSVTSWLVWAVTVSDLSANLNKPAVSVADGLAAPKPPSQVAISCSGRVSISGSIWTSGTTLIPRPSRARDLLIMAEVDSGRVPSLDASLRASDQFPGALRRNSTRWVRPRALPGWVYRYPTIHNPSIEYSGFYVRNTGIFWCRSTSTANTTSTTMQCKMHFTNE